jgi:NCS1 family nucleobase:cation symporter-1
MAGIEPVLKGERNLKGFDFLILWAGAAVSLAEIWAGGLIAPLGLGLGLLSILLGHLIGKTPLALGGLIGSRWGEVPSDWSLTTPGRFFLIKLKQTCY